MDNIQAPVVNSNGTSKEALVSQLKDVYVAGRAMLEAMAEATPHGRDYQTAPPGTYQVAMQQHEDREARILSVLEEIEAIVGQL